MFVLKRVIVSALSVIAVSSVYGQVAVNLGNDFSISSGNPNGQWSYLDNSQLLTLQSPINNGNALYPALSGGYWGLGNDLNANTPDLFKAQVSGSVAGETDLDFLAKDIVGHSPNDGKTLFVQWIAPSAGTISNLTMSVWYAHSVVNRSNDFVLLDNAAILTAGTVNSSSFSNRNNAATYSNAGFAVSAGDKIALGLTKTNGQSFGSLAGESLAFTYTSNAVPEPASLLCLGLGALALRRKRTK